MPGLGFKQTQKVLKQKRTNQISSKLITSVCKISCKEDIYAKNKIYTNCKKIKEKKKILKVARGEKHLTYRVTKMRITFNFSEIVQARKDCNEIFKVSREKKNSTNSPA